MDRLLQDVYVVRIYRRDADDPCKITGLVEIIGAEGTKAFKDRDELWKILLPPENARKKATGKKAQRREA